MTCLDAADLRLPALRQPGGLFGAPRPHYVFQRIQSRLRRPQSTISGLGTIVALTHSIALAASTAARMPSSEKGNLFCIS